MTTVNMLDFSPKRTIMSMRFSNIEFAHKRLLWYIRITKTSHIFISTSLFYSFVGKYLRQKDALSIPACPGDRSWDPPGQRPCHRQRSSSCDPPRRLLSRQPCIWICKLHKVSKFFVDKWIAIEVRYWHFIVSLFRSKIWKEFLKMNCKFN